MAEQIYILENCKSFEPKHIFECGQCFRWNKEQDESYTGVFNNNVLNVKKINEYKIKFEGICEGNIKDVVEEYFDLDTNYEEIKKKLSLIDKYMLQGIEYGKGIRILKQDLWECIISFIISANNNIPRIKGIIERISKAYGKQIKFSRKRLLYFSYSSGVI
ncbi:MAG: 8-oxoguanine DNA glycosylase, N-terminal domain-containing protein [Lachnospiraceae bacterium]|nr:8-oxoguanine DNA glycosylase, N-terminal domain-containing protein [Lachnospiraceae bacterium]